MFIRKKTYLALQQQLAGQQLLIERLQEALSLIPVDKLGDNFVWLPGKTNLTKIKQLINGETTNA